MKKTIIIILIISLGVYAGIKINNIQKNNINNNSLISKQESQDMNKNAQISYIETSVNDEIRTTPNTLMIFKTYYTKCKHYVQEYEEIDASLVNNNEEEIKEKYKEWNIDSFSSQEVILLKEEEKFCNQHYKLKLNQDKIVIYNVDENGQEIEYEQTSITTEYLTDQDILKLKSGIIIYGKENLINAIEDYE